MAYRRTFSGRQKTVKSIPELKKINDLSIPDLKKFLKSLEKYYEKVNINDIENQKNNKIIIDAYDIFERNKTAKIKAIKEELERFERLSLNPKKDNLNKVYADIKKHSESGLSTMFGGYTRIYGMSVPNGVARKLDAADTKASQEYKAAEEKFDKIKSELSKAEGEYGNGRVINTISSPKDNTTLKIGGVNLKVNFRTFKLEDVKNLLQQKEAVLRNKQERDKEALNEIKARAAYKENEVRSQVGKYKKDYEIQKEKLTNCPYCETDLTKSDAHLDHIYPVSKGGLSLRKNLIFVCSSCNQKKGNMTLRNFITKFELDLHLIYERLDMLGKDF